MQGLNEDRWVKQIMKEGDTNSSWKKRVGEVENADKAWKKTGI